VIDHPHNSSHLPDEAALEHPTAIPQAPAVSAADAPQARDETSAPGEATPHGDWPAASPSEPPALAEPAEAAPPLAAEHHDAPQTHELVAAEAPEEVAEEEVEPRGPIEEIVVAEEPPKMDWYILKVQSNREESIRDSLQRRVKVAGLERYFGEIIVPTEMVSEFKGGKKRVVKRKLYPGYLVAHMEINDETWFLVRETPGIGDFTGSAGKPTPMQPHEVTKIVAKQEEKTDEAPKLKINFNVGDRVKINEGTFENFEGEVDSIDEASGRVTVMINIFGRSTPVELEYWQIEAI
jgi:transcriptional antiterminator NusG